MKSCLFSGFVQHERLKPVQHRLHYPLYVYCLNLDELKELDRSLPLFGYNRFRPASIHDRDYLDDGPGTIKEKLLRLLESEGCADSVATIMLITSARYFNYVFNPVSFYYCFSTEDDLVCTVAEVSNTFGERHIYILRETDAPVRRFPARFSAPKQFHVSPFNDMNGTYEFLLSDIRKELKIRINLYWDNELAFYGELTGDMLPLTRPKQKEILFKHPLVPHLTIPRIYWQAAKLFLLKKLSYHPKPVPINMMTIRRNPPTFLQKQSMKYILRLLEQTKYGHLRMTLPGGAVKIYGNDPDQQGADVTINDYGFFSRVLLGGDIGLGESFMEAKWDSPDPSEFVQFLILNSDTIANGNFVTTAYTRLRDRIRHLLRGNTLRGARRNIRRHYDLSNAFFKTFLDKTMTYSCGLFLSDRDTLVDAQKNKLHSIIRKACISKDDHVLEIGCGWGGFAMEAVRQTGCRVTGITLSSAQFEYAREEIKKAGLEGRITILLRDYRKMEGIFDKIISIEMLEAVGHRYFGKFFQYCDQLLKQGGLVVLQTITIPDQQYDAYRKGTDWIRKHIFPGGHLPSVTAISRAMTEHSTLTIDHLENIGLDYARTLREWRNRFIENIDAISGMGFDRTFQRKWIYYFSFCEAGFASRVLGNIQIVLNRPGSGIPRFEGKGQ